MAEEEFWDKHAKDTRVEPELAFLDHHPLTRHIVEFVRPRIAEGRRLRLLEAGCGTGRWNFHLSRLFGERIWTVGLDFSDILFTGARYGRSIGADRCHFCKGTVERLPFADASFDVILCLGVIEHFNPPAGAMSELRRVLAPGGKLYVVTPRAFHADPHDHDAEVEIDYTLPQLVQLMGNSDMRVEESYTCCFHFRVFYVLNYLRKRVGLGRPGGLFYRLLGKTQLILRPLNVLGDPAGWGFYNIVIAGRGEGR